MRKKILTGMACLLFLSMLAALLFSQTHFSVLAIFKNGINRGESLEFIEQGWEYTVNDDETRYTTTLPCVLELPPDAERLIFYNVIPADVADGDVLRLQTQLGAYQVFVDDRLIDEIGQNATEKTYLYDCATAVLYGIGLSGIRRTAEKHNGYFKTSIEHEVFHLEVALSNLFL